LGERPAGRGGGKVTEHQELDGESAGGQEELNLPEKSTGMGEKSQADRWHKSLQIGVETVGKIKILSKDKGPSGRNLGFRREKLIIAGRTGTSQFKNQRRKPEGTNLGGRGGGSPPVRNS